MSKTSRLRRAVCVTVAASMTVSFGLTGCASSSKDVAATYISPLQYQTYDCQQLALESERIQRRVVELGGRLDEAAANDKALVGVGMILFWPALFALGGTKQQEAEYARLRGEYDALQQASIQKSCANALTPPAAPAPAASAAAAS